MTLEEAKREAIANAARTGEPWAVCSNSEGNLFVAPLDSYTDQQLWAYGLHEPIDFCECNEQPVEEEQASGTCSACGKPL